MRKMLSAALAAVVLTVSAPAAAQLVPVSNVTPNGTYGGNLASLTDGVFPADGSSYNDPATEVFFGPNETNLTATSFDFDFGGLFSINGFSVVLDNNDDYSVLFYNNGVLSGGGGIPYNAGFVSNGVERFNVNFGVPFLATSVRIAATGQHGDGRYSIGEVQVRGTAVEGAVPEPATWAMMLLGFGGIGFAVRKQRNSLLQIA